MTVRFAFEAISTSTIRFYGRYKVFSCCPGSTSVGGYKYHCLGQLDGITPFDRLQPDFSFTGTVTDIGYLFTVRTPFPFPFIGSRGAGDITGYPFSAGTSNTSPRQLLPGGAHPVKDWRQSGYLLPVSFLFGHRYCLKSA